MSITQKRPFRIETVGAMYLVFASNIETLTYEAGITKYETVKQISSNDNNESEPVYASGKVYDNLGQSASIENEVEAVAFDPNDIAKMKGETVNVNGLVLAGAPTDKPFFAFGKTIKKTGGAYEFVWYPKCQLVSLSDEASTKEDRPSEQNVTATISAMPFDSNGNVKVYIDSQHTGFPEWLTEDLFFSQVIHSSETFPTQPEV